MVSHGHPINQPKSSIPQEEVQAQIGHLERALTKFQETTIPWPIEEFALTIPELPIYDGNTCPRAHVKHYCQRIAPLTKDDNILFRLFQNSLSRQALRWFLSLEPKNVTSWTQLSHLFVNRFAHKWVTKPTVGDLESMVQSQNETFQAYVERWLVTNKQTEHQLFEVEALRMLFRLTQPSLRDLLSIQNV